MLIAVPRYALPTYALPSYALPGDYPSAPAAPSNPSATAISATQVNLAWTDNSADVAGVNEVQTVTFSATPLSGTYTLTHDAETTDAIAYNADASAITAALEATAAFEVGDVSVSKSGSVITITYQGGLAAMNVPPIECDASLLKVQSSATMVNTVVGNETTQKEWVLTLHADTDAGVFQIMLDSELQNGTVAFDASAATLQTFLDNLFSSGVWSVTGSDGGPWTIVAPLGFLNSLDVYTGALEKPGSATIATTTQGSPQSWAELGFEVHRSTDGSSYSLLVDLGANLESWPDETCSPATQYWYKVRAYNAGGNSAFTSAVTATTPSAGGSTYIFRMLTGVG